MRPNDADESYRAMADVSKAPTNDAIPIEWLKERYKTEGVSGTESYFRKAHVVEQIIKDWLDFKADLMY